MPELKTPFREKVAIAVDGGGLRGIAVAKALVMLEEALGKKVADIVSLSVGTSTGAIIAAALAAGLDAKTILDTYVEYGPRIFAKSLRTLPIIRLLVPFRYKNDALFASLETTIGPITIGELHQRLQDEGREFSLVITTADVYAGQTRFIKLSKPRYANWKVSDAVVASSTIPGQFPVFEHVYATPDNLADPDEAWIPEPRSFLDGGLGSYSNPSFIAAYEAAFCLSRHGWSLGDTTLISMGTGINPQKAVWRERTNNFRIPPRRFWQPKWLAPTIDQFLLDANTQQLRLVKQFFTTDVNRRANDDNAGLDFRRYNVNFDERIVGDEVKMIPALLEYGEELGNNLINDIRENFGEYSCTDDTDILNPLSRKIQAHSAL